MELKQQKFIISQFGRLEVQGQGVNSLFLLKALRKNLFHVCPLASGGLLEILGIPWLAGVSLLFPASSLHGDLSVSVTKCPLDIRTSVILDESLP